MGSPLSLYERSQLLEQGSKGVSCGRRQASHVTVVLSKSALSVPSVRLRARAPCPLRVSCPGADRAKRAAKLQALALRCLLGSRHVYMVLVYAILQISNCSHLDCEICMWRSVQSSVDTYSSVFEWISFCNSLEAWLSACGGWPCLYICIQVL